MKAIVTGGGTGGHIYPALAVARGLLEKDWEVLFVGSTNSLESRLIPEEGLPFQEIEVAPLSRKINLKLFSTLGKTVKGVFQARKIIKSFKPDAVLGTGGYVTGPVLLAASLLKYPTIIHEQNVYPGLTNRLLARFVDIIALNFTDAERYFPDRIKRKIKVTGNPIRDIIMKKTRQEGINGLGLLNNRKNILVFGGSQGALSINNSMVEVYKTYQESRVVQIIHLTGEKNYQSIIEKLEKESINLDKITHFKLMPYLKKIELAYAVADLIIYRAGATGIAEITARGIPAILIPYPYAAENHQEYNARTLEKHGAAIVIEDRELTGEKLVKNIKNLLENKEVLSKMAVNSKLLGKPEARDNLVRLVEENVNC